MKEGGAVGEHGSPEDSLPSGRRNNLYLMSGVCGV